MIHISLSPNLEKDDLLLSQKKLLTFFLPHYHQAEQQLLKELHQYYPKASAIFLLNSGRAALMVGLKSLKLEENSKVLLQSFTCSVVPNSILWNKLIPEYLNIQKNDYNLDPNFLPKKTTAKALIVQHTFGQPAKLKTFINYAKKHNLYLIEDCAHSLGAKYQGDPVGSFGDWAILSFGRDKVISSVFGGALIVNNPKLVKPIEELYRTIPYPRTLWTFQQLIHPSITYLSKATYSFFVGKLILWLGQQTKMLSKAIYPQEYKNKVPPIFPKRLPNELATLALHQFNKLDRFNKKRLQISEFYDQQISNKYLTKPILNPEGICLRYTVLLDKPENLKNYLKKFGVVIDKNHWYTSPITPAYDTTNVYYQSGQNQITEDICRKCFNLPTNPTMSLDDAKFIVYLINQWQP